MASKPGSVCYTEEMILSPKYVPEYMQHSRRFRVEYRDPVSGFSNFEAVIYLNKDDPNPFLKMDKIRDLIATSYDCK